MDSINTAEFLKLLGHNSHIEEYRRDKDYYLKAYEFFMGLPYLSAGGKAALMGAMATLITGGDHV